LFSLTVLFGFMSIAALLYCVVFILRELGASDAARGLMIASALCIVVSVALVYLT